MDTVMDLVKEVELRKLQWILLSFYPVFLVTVLVFPDGRQFLAGLSISQALQPYIFVYPLVMKVLAVGCLLYLLASLLLTRLAGKVWANQVSRETQGVFHDRLALKKKVEQLAVDCGVWYWIMMGYGLCLGFPVYFEDTRRYAIFLFPLSITAVIGVVKLAKGLLGRPE